MNKAMFLVAVAAALSGSGYAAPGPTQQELNSAAGSTEWLLPNHDYAGVRYVNLDQIRPGRASCICAMALALVTGDSARSQAPEQMPLRFTSQFLFVE